MPRGDGSGPEGLGSMTGRGLGYCVGYDRHGCANQGFLGRNRAYGFRGGRSTRFGRGYPEGRRMRVVRGEDEINYLEAEAKALKEELKIIEDNLKSLKED
ncbi:DUF5320 domain-containing protein [Orenia marismortui]|uniref:DUF5320 domain-containing protein n=1 Tax=Orenia marismortui TaxID=46469 RepID=UPI00036E8F36|nr:DUF5320 domain-containing protein [Orenia marismortui]